MELGRAINLFLGGHIKSTRDSYAPPLFMLRDNFGTARSLTRISVADLMSYQQDVLDTKGWANATVLKHVRTIKVFFNWCVKVLRELESSPASGMRFPKIAKAVDRSKAMQDQELAALLSELETSPRDYALLMFLADTGCRRGGAAGLRLQDVNWTNFTALITEKGERERIVAFGDLCAIAMRRWLTYRMGRYEVSGIYFWTRHGTPIAPASLSQVVRRACRRAGIRIMSTHSLRHRKGHQLADARVAPTIAALVLGHKDVKTTMENYYPTDTDTVIRASRELAINDRRVLAAQPSNVVILKAK